MSRFALSLVFVLLGCAGSVADGADTTQGAATSAPPPTIAGNYDGHMRGWFGSLAITNASPRTFDFAFEISPDLDIAPIGRLGGTAKLQDGGDYRYDDGSCSITFDPNGQRGDLFVNASISCAVMLGIDGHSTSSTALDFTATWRRL